jgi:hypothetical protein
MPSYRLHCGLLRDSAVSCSRLHLTHITSHSTSLVCGHDPHSETGESTNTRYWFVKVSIRSGGEEHVVGAPSWEM